MSLLSGLAPHSEISASGSPRLGLVVAVARNGTIGRSGTLPWRFPEDLKYFKALTTGHRIIMGRRTWESFPRPLPNREHVVITSRKLDVPPGVVTVTSLAQALALPIDTTTVFVIGGNAAYSEALPIATDLYLTEIDADVEGDTEFPAWPKAEFEEVSRQSACTRVEGIGDSVNYSFVHYQRPRHYLK